MATMNSRLENMADESILRLPMMDDKRLEILMKLYTNLKQVLYFADPSLGHSVNLRMVDITISSGLSSRSPIAFAFYGESLAAAGKLELAARLGRLALKLLDDSSANKSSIICYVSFEACFEEPVVLACLNDCSSDI